MRRREFIALLGGAAAAWPLAAHAQSGKRMLRIGVIPSSEEGDPQSDAQVAALRASLEVLGWKEGRDIQIELRRHGGDAGRAAAVAMEIAGSAPDVIWASGTVGLTALHKATTQIPIVFVNVTDPVAGGFVASLARPGGNITGITPFEYEIGGKWLELLKETAPGVRRVTLLGESANHNFRGFQKSFEDYARSISVEPISVDVRSAADVERGIRNVGNEPNGGLIVTASTFSIVHRNLILALARELKVPAIYWNRSLVVAGGLISYGPDITDLSRQSAVYVDRILKGAKPTELAVQTPVKFQLIVNARTAKAMGFDIPPLLLAQADEVIE
jgi:putative tryptophan/tyrosine transport system substrate-binding protein